MATNNINSNYFSVAASTNKGLSGLISGLDTESMVKQMMAATQKKIDNQLAAKQRLIWKQDLYRSVITSINNLRNKYFNPAFDASPLNNLASSKFFNARASAVTSGSSVRVISTGYNAPVGDINITVDRLATSTTLISGKAVGDLGDITGKELTADMLAAFDKTLVLNVSGAVDSIAVDLNGVGTQQAMLDKINDALLGTGAVAKLYDNKLRIITDAVGKAVSVSSRSSDLALKMTGLARGDRSAALETTEPGQMLQGGNMISPNAGVSFTVNLDGVSKQITLNPVSSGTYDPDYKASNPKYNPIYNPAHPGYGALNPVEHPNMLDWEEDWDPADPRNFKISIGDLAANLNAELDRVFGDYTDASVDPIDQNKIILSLNFGGEGGHSLTIYGTEAEKLGFVNGASTRLSTASKLGELGDDLLGERFTFSINGKEFTFTSEDTIGTVINRVNSGNAGVQMSYSSLSNKFMLTATSTGEQFKIDLEQTEGNLLGVMFQYDGAGYTPMIDAGSIVSSGYLTVGGIQGKILTTAEQQAKLDKNAQFRVNVNGQDYICPLPSDREYTTIEAVNMVNQWFEETFGLTDPGDPGSDANIYFNASTGQLEINGNFTVKFAQTSVNAENASAYAAGIKQDIALAMGLNNTAKSNIANGLTTVGEVPQLADLINELNVVMPPGYTYIDTSTFFDKPLSELNGDSPFTFGFGEAVFANGRLSVSFSGPVTLNEGNALDDMIVSLFGGTYKGGVYEIKTGSGAMDPGIVSAGMDAEVTINGVTTTRSSNLFEFDGLTIELTSVGDSVINTQRDTDSIVTAFKSFVEDYNSMIDLINGLVYADPTYRDYAPLTDEQKKEMSDREIELWEANAKGGLLRNDDILLPFLNDLYRILYTRPVSSPFALYDIGIEAPDYKQPGKLVLDETALRRALADDPAAVEALFTDSVNGISKSMGDLMDRVARVSIATPGSLVSLAGVQGSYTEKTSSLNSDLERINDRLKDLWDRYEKERARYWNQFNAMERILSQYQSQSEWLYQAVAGMNSNQG